MTGNRACFVCDSVITESQCPNHPVLLDARYASLGFKRVVVKASRLIQSDSVGLKGGCVAGLKIDGFHAIHDNLRFGLELRGRIVCQQTARFAGLEIDYDDCVPLSVIQA
jgi:hypothetical protein